MQFFKKIILPIITIVFVLFALSVALIFAYMHSEFDAHQDLNSRNKEAGKLEYLFIGGSHGGECFNKTVFNEKMNTHSWNLCGVSEPPRGMLEFLSEEIDRNPIKTVIFDVGDDTLTYDYNDYNGSGDICLIPRLNSFSQRINYFFTKTEYSDCAKIYGTFMNKGVRYISCVVTGRYVPSSERVQEDFYKSMKLTDDEIVSKKSTVHIPCKSKQENVDVICRILELCKEKNIEVVFVGTPLSDNYFWVNNGYKEIKNDLLNIADKYDLAYIDFNLYKEKSNLLPDETAYADESHCCPKGARDFTAEFCKLLKMYYNKEDMSDLFYADYDEMLMHSPYAE